MLIGNDDIPVEYEFKNKEVYKIYGTYKVYKRTAGWLGGLTDNPPEFNIDFNGSSLDDKGKIHYVVMFDHIENDSELCQIYHWLKANEGRDVIFSGGEPSGYRFDFYVVKPKAFYPLVLDVAR